MEEKDGTPYFIEVRTVGFSEEDDRRNSVSDEIFSRLKAIPSSYSARATVGDRYSAGSPELDRATTKVIDALKATFYYSYVEESVLNFGGDLDLRTLALTEKEKRYRSIAEKVQ